MSLLTFLGAGAGLIQGLQQNKSAAGQQRRALDLYDQARQNAAKDQAFNVEQARQLKAAGYGNADAQVAALRGAYDVNQGIAQRNAAGAYSALGYEPGDTPWSAQSQSLSSRGLAQQALLEQNARTQAAQQNLSLLPLYSSGGVNQAIYGQANAIAGNPLNQQRDLSGNVASLVASVSPQPNPYQVPVVLNNGQRQPWDEQNPAYLAAAADTDPYGQYDAYGNPIPRKRTKSDPYGIYGVIG